MWVFEGRVLPGFDGEPVAVAEGSEAGVELAVENEAVDEFESMSISGIEAFAEDADWRQFGGGNIEGPREVFGELGFGDFYWGPQIGDSQQHNSELAVGVVDGVEKFRGVDESGQL